MIEQPQIKVLVIEESEGNSKIVEAILAEKDSGGLELNQVSSLEDALWHLKHKVFDVIMIDLSVPDAHGFDALIKLNRQAPNIATIVITASDYETHILKVIKTGVEDVVTKGDLGQHAVTQAIYHAIERYRATAELKDMVEGLSDKQETRPYDRFSFFPMTDITPQLFGLAPLSQSLPETFAEIVNCYGELLGELTKRRDNHVERYMTETLRVISQQLGLLKAGPKDVVEIHVTALKHKLHEIKQDKMHLYIERSRLLALDFMGYLVSYYRSYAYLSEKYKQNSLDISAMIADKSDRNY